MPKLVPQLGHLSMQEPNTHSCGGEFQVGTGQGEASPSSEDQGEAFPSSEGRDEAPPLPGDMNEAPPLLSDWHEASPVTRGPGQASALPEIRGEAPPSSSQGIVVRVRSAHDIATESQVTVQALRVVYSGFSSKK